MENIVFCPSCKSENLENSVYCCQCGQPMRRGLPIKVRKEQWIVIIAISLVLTVALTAGIYVFSHHRGQKGITNQVQESPETASTLSATNEPAASIINQQAQTETTAPLSREEQVANELDPLVLGTVSITNPEGLVVNEFPAVVINGSWLALPTRACIGGDKWFFKVGNEKAIPIEGGLWGPGDAVGLWKLGGGKTYPGPAFSTWDQGEDVRFLSITTGLLYEPAPLTPSGMQGVFIYSSDPQYQEAGVFVQNGNVVGWTFGDLLAGSYMWVLGSGADLLYENYVDDFYNETFAGGREEYFSSILASRNNLSPQKQLQMFADAFRRRPKLRPEDTPNNLRTENIYPIIAKLVDQVLKLGDYNYVAMLAEEPMLWEVADSLMLNNVAFATQKVYGAEAALNFLEGRGEEILRALQGNNYTPLKIHLELHLTLIKSSIDNGEIGKAQQYFNRSQSWFKDTPAVHLLGVELALASGDWELAEKLLYQREYPPKFSDRVSILADRISDLKGFENKIVISFQPGSGEIPVSTTVNEKIDQDFLIDTGATYVTIPYSTIEALGLENKMSQHQQEVQTAGGPVLANAVILSSIELQGWIISDVKALVIDIPNRPGLGLLGLDFLNRFNLDMQANDGTLTLEPK